MPHPFPGLFNNSPHSFRLPWELLKPLLHYRLEKVKDNMSFRSREFGCIVLKHSTMPKYGRAVK